MWELSAPLPLEIIWPGRRTTLPDVRTTARPGQIMANQLVTRWEATKTFLKNPTEQWGVWGVWSIFCYEDSSWKDPFVLHPGLQHNSGQAPSLPGTILNKLRFDDELVHSEDVVRSYTVWALRSKNSSSVSTGKEVRDSISSVFQCQNFSRNMMIMMAWCDLRILERRGPAGIS